MQTKALAVGTMCHKLSLHIRCPTRVGECSPSAGKTQLKEMQT